MMAYLGMGSMNTSDTCQVAFEDPETGVLTDCGRRRHGTIQAVLVNPTAARHHRFVLCKSHQVQHNAGIDFRPVKPYARRSS